MPITHIQGPPNSGKTNLANSLRTTAIMSKKGALLIDDHADGEAKHHLEKIIAGDRFIEGTPADKVRWKSDHPHILLVNSGIERLKEFEDICPGFIAKFGPVRVMKTDQA